jgi:hypothetical protein
MKILDSIVLSYWVFIRSAKKNQLVATLYAASISLGLILTSIILYFTHFISGFFINPVLIGLSTIAICYIIDKLLNSVYKDKKVYLESVFLNHYNVLFLKGILALFGLLLYLLSIMLILFSFRFVLIYNAPQ